MCCKPCFSKPLCTHLPRLWEAFWVCAPGEPRHLGGGGCGWVLQRPLTRPDLRKVPCHATQPLRLVGWDLGTGVRSSAMELLK